MLAIAVTATSIEDAAAVAESWRSLARLHDNDDVRVDVIAWPPELPISACYQLVVGIDGGPPAQSDHDSIDVMTDSAGSRSLWRERLLPFRDNLAANRRAPRRQVAELAAKAIRSLKTQGPASRHTLENLLSGEAQATAPAETLQRK